VAAPCPTCLIKVAGKAGYPIQILTQIAESGRTLKYRMKRSNRKDAISTLVSKGMLTEDGARSLILSLDPFHDTNVFPIGLPDTRTDPSVVQVVKKTFNLSAPAGLSTGTWDCHIVSLPERQDWNGLNSGSTSGSCVVSQAGAVQPLGEIYYDGTWHTKTATFPIAPMLAVAVNSGANTFPDIPKVIPTNLTFTDVNFNDYYFGQSRIVGSAFEVHNTTAELYKQGTVTVYRLPQTLIKTSSLILDYDTSNSGLPIGATNTTAPCVTSRLPPSNPASALLLPDSKQWEAAYGAYCVDTFDHDRNVPETTENVNRVFALGDWAGGVGESAPFQEPSYLPCIFSCVSPALAGAPETGTTGYGAPCFKPIPRNSSGAYFSGLSPQTTLTLTVHYIVETFPSQPSPLVTLARPTPDYDPMFFKLYKEASRLLPPGVMVGENASGDFWDTCLGIIGDIAPVIGNAIPIPGFGALGGIAGTAAKSAQTSRNKPSSGKAKAEELSGKPENKFVGSNNLNSQQLTAAKQKTKGKLTKSQKKSRVEMI